MFSINKKLCHVNIGRLLFEDGIIDLQQFNLLKINTSNNVYEHALEEIAARNWPHKKYPGTSLNLDWLSKWVAQKMNLDFLDINRVCLPSPNVISKISNSYALQNKICPIEIKGNCIHLAVCEPMLVDSWRKDIERIYNMTVKILISNPRSLRDFIRKLYNDVKENINNDIDISNIISSGNRVLNIGHVDKIDDANAVSTLDIILHSAFECGASDIHIEPHISDGIIRFRVDGRMHDFKILTKQVTTHCVNRLKIMSGMDFSEKRMPQDSRIRVVNKNGNEVELRLSTMPTAVGEKIVMRIFNPDVLVMPMDSLGFSAMDREIWDRMISHPHGLILVTGPTGSGKTTTLYSSLRDLASSEINISTIEDPVELFNDRFNQMQVNPTIGLTFPVGIRTLLRQDPDIIMIGEIRDAESAEVAIQAALTGHLVLASMHTNDAPSTITRLLDLNVPPYLIKASLVGIVAQRLIRVLCKFCKKHTEITNSDWDFLVSPIRVTRPEKIFSPAGCEKCNLFGFKGRTAIYEMLYITDSISRLITPAADAAMIRRASLRMGMLPLRVSGAKKVASGDSCFEEIVRVIPPEFEWD